MNEHIANLAEQAAQESALIENEMNLEVVTEDKTYAIPAEFIQRFAELIVQKCAEITLDYKNEDHYQGWLDHQEEILKQFGVTYEN